MQVSKGLNVKRVFQLLTKIIGSLLFIGFAVIIGVGINCTFILSQSNPSYYEKCGEGAGIAFTAIFALVAGIITLFMTISAFRLKTTNENNPTSTN